jgi:hypothetical protein
MINTYVTIIFPKLTNHLMKIHVYFLVFFLGNLSSNVSANFTFCMVFADLLFGTLTVGHRNFG